MKAKTIILKIEKQASCSIREAELLTNALHREKLLEENRSVRFRPLYGDFDIVNSDLFTTQVFRQDLYEKIGNIEDLKTRFIG